MSHSYKTIYNWPVERQRRFYTWCYWDNAFNGEELDKIEDMLGKEELERGTTIGEKPVDKANTENSSIQVAKTNSSNSGGVIVSQQPNEKARKSDVKFINFDNFQGPYDFIFDRLNYVVESINNQYYNFDINGYESFQYTVYHDHEEGKYDWHQDTIMGGHIPNDMFETRKLSITFLVNDPEKDFEGGQFQINTGQEKDAESIPFKRGRIIVFPSFMIHRVAPVTKGIRKSIVVWVMGPKFR